MTDWTADANEAFKISLVRSKEDSTVLSKEESYLNFHPTFTYPIFGEDEKIYGYEDLIIDFKCASGSLAQCLTIKYANKLESSAGTVDDVEGTLSEFIPEGYYKDEAEFMKRVEEDAVNFKPTGQLIHSYTRSLGKGKGKDRDTHNLDPESDNAVEFEVYHATWHTPGFKEHHRRMQLFILFYIEAGSYINEDEEPWEFFVLYEKRKRPEQPGAVSYHFVGYSSLYPFYHYPDKVRMRLSQFVILPPYQRQAHGSELYNAIYRYIVSQPSIAELTVEDPAEAFEDLRDRNDLKMLTSHLIFMEEAFGTTEVSHGGGRAGGVGKHKKSGRGGATEGGVKGKMGPPVDKKWAEKWRLQLKIAGRQFQRLIEMLMLLRLDPFDTAALKAYRLQVKERLYRFNFEILAQLDKEERLLKLEETFQNVQDGYARILAMA